MSVCSQALLNHLLEDLEEACPRFERNKAAPPEASSREFAAFQMAKEFLSKDRDSPMPSARSKAISKFIDINKRCQEWEPRSETLLDDLLIGEFKSSVYRFLHPNGENLFHSLFDLLDHGRTGPGASLGSRGNDFYSKFFASPVTASNESLIACYLQWVKNIPFWDYAERHRSQVYGDISIVRESRLTTVPKKNDCDRVICIEPSLNMYYQLGLEDILRERLLSYFHINLENQADFNRVLSYLGSVFGLIVTIDLTSASDSAAMKMLRKHFPRWFVDYLSIIRSPSTSIDGVTHELHMVSSMGNGSTFPLETMIFACAVEAVFRLDNLKPRARGNYREGRAPNFGVFGDDIIVPKQCTNKLFRLLELLGFQLNPSKTFIEGPFRESCGFDYHNGNYVRPVYVKTLKDQGSRYALINNLFKWSFLTEIPLSRTIKYLLKFVKWNTVPLDENDDSGIKVPFVFASNYRRCRHTGSIQYRRFIVKGRYYEIKDFFVVAPGSSKDLIYNPNGLMLAFLRGSVYDSSIAIRLKRTSYRSGWRVTPNWDYVPSGSFPLSGKEFDWGRLTTSYYLNLKAR